MFTIRVKLLTLAFIGSLALGYGSKTRAADEPNPPAKSPPAEKSKWILPKYYDQLDLSDEQKDRVTRTAEAFNPKINRLKKTMDAFKGLPSSGTTVITTSLMLQKLVNERQKQLEMILSEEQRQKYRELKAKGEGAPQPAPKKFKELLSKSGTPSGEDSPNNESLKVLKGLTQAELDKAVRDFKEWQPIAINGYAEGKESRFDLTWESLKKSGRWHLYTDMSAEGFAKRKEELSKAGFKVGVQSSWLVADEERFAAIWCEK